MRWTTLLTLLLIKGTGHVHCNGLLECARRYGAFFAEEGREAVPVSEEGRCRFAAMLADEGLKHRTIRHLHIEEGVTDPFEKPLHRLHYMLREVKRCEGEHGEANEEGRMRREPARIR